MEELKNPWDLLTEELKGWWEVFVKSLPNLVVAIIVLIISIIITRKISSWARTALARTTNNQTLIDVGSSIATALFFLLTLFIVVSIMGWSEAITTALGAAGVIGLAIGLALQDPLINLFSGVMMSVKDYYKVGDLVKTNGFFGKISHITLRATIIEDLDGEEVIIPNKDIMQNPLVNYSHNGKRRITLNCGVAYGDDLQEVKKIVLDTVKNKVKHEENLPVQMFYTDFGDSSINFQLRFWRRISTQGDYLEARHQAIVALKTAFDEAGVTIPFPIRTLDFGVVGGVPINEMYPADLLQNSTNGKPVSTKNGATTEQIKE